jgi:nucleotide-binding universal stress UspA family protein
VEEKMPIKKILIPVDGTELSDSVLNPVHRMLAGEGGEITLLRVVEGGECGAWPALRATQERLLAMVPNHASYDLKTQIRVVEGDPASVVLDCVARDAPDLIAMVTHARTGLPRLLKGSVAEAVLRSSATPMLLCNSHGSRATGCKAPFLRILVPLDGSETSHRAFPSAIDLAKAEGAEVILLRVVDSGLHEGSEEFARIGRYLNRSADRFTDAGIKTTRLFVASGKPAATILETLSEQRVDLVVMATHGRTGVDRLRLGSVAEEVLRHSPCPLLIVGGHEATSAA